jgi:hypothetical protein
MDGNQMTQTAPIMRAIVKRIPQVRPLLTPRARWMTASPAPYKTAEFMTATIERMVRTVYEGYLGGEFIDIMANLIQGQFTQAYTRTVLGEGLVMDAEFEAHLDELILGQFDFVDQYFRDIINARIDATPIDPLLARASLWGNRYNEVVSEANAEIARRFGKRLVWRLGATEQHCTTCAALNGIVAFAREWDAAGFKPQAAPNALLECGGWRCDCSLTITDQRRSPRALETLLNIGVSGNL